MAAGFVPAITELAKWSAKKAILHSMVQRTSNSPAKAFACGQTPKDPIPTILITLPYRIQDFLITASIRTKMLFRSILGRLGCFSFRAILTFLRRMCRSKTFMAAVLTYLMFKLFKRQIGDQVRVLFSYLLEKCSARVNCERLREQLRVERVPPSGRLFSQHSHPAAASVRTTSNNMVDNIIYGSGYVPWSLSMSPREQRAGISGSRHYYFSKDVEMNTSNSTVHAAACFKLIDVDYYVDMPNLLTQGKPIVLYTFTPNAVAGIVPDGSYTSLSGNVVNLKINGGAEYQHPLWDYDHDHIQVDTWWGSVVSLCESRVHPEDNTRRVVTITPTRIIYGPLGWFLNGYRLSRRQFAFGQFACSHYQEQIDGKTTLQWSFGALNDRVCAVIPDEKLKTAVIRAQLSKNLAVSDIERVFRQVDNIDAAFSASVFLQIWDSNKAIFGTLLPIQTLQANISIEEPHFQTLAPLITEVGKSIGRPIINPFVTEPAVMPRKSLNNDHACVRGRILDVKTNVSMATIKPAMKRYMIEFATLLIPDHLAHTGVPLDYATLEEHQKRPSQLASSARERLWADLSKFYVASFQKSETYPKIVAPRNISNCPQYHRIRYGEFLLSFAEVLKETEWYAFGIHPREFSARMNIICENAEFITPSDFSKMDGTHSECLAEFEMWILRRYFAPDYHKELEKLNTEQRNCTAVTAEGVFYDPGFSRLSGSAETSALNTIDNAFSVYATLRKTMDQLEAWNRLGIYGGDDGCTRNLDGKYYESVCKTLGLVAKVEKVLPGNPVTFLGRVFVDPWTSPESVIDIPRCLSKLHLYHHNDDVPIRCILGRRALGLIQTDVNTPIISDLARNILRLTGEPTEYENGRYNLQRLDQWWTRYGNPFVAPDYNNDAAWKYLLGALDTTRDHIERVIKYWDACDDVTKLGLPEELRFFSNRKIDCEAAVGGVLVTPPLRQQTRPYPRDDNYRPPRKSWTGFRQQQRPYNSGARWR
jgi:hypothetical protein